jgi:hypothetical protein
MDMLKIPQWIKNARKEDDMSDDTPIMPPPIATLPEFTAHDEELSLMQRAAVLHAQLRRKIETANVELAESVLGRQGDQQKVAFLEKENADLRLGLFQSQNTIATLQADILDKDKFMSLVRQVLDKYEIKAPPKKERKPRQKKPEPESAPKYELTTP